jgi:hypothetical protein
LIEAGLILEEPEFKERPDQIPGIDYENVDFYSEKKDLPFPPELNQQKHKILSKFLEEKK